MQVETKGTCFILACPFLLQSIFFSLPQAAQLRSGRERLHLQDQPFSLSCPIAPTFNNAIWRDGKQKRLYVEVYFPTLGAR